MSGLELAEGGQEFCDWFGVTPSFHDAEVLALHLDRAGPTRLTIHTWRISDKIKDGHFVLEKHVVVDFCLDAVSDCDLTGFNHQNVIDGIEIVKIPSGLKLTLGDCFGLYGSLVARSIHIEFKPGHPKRPDS
jgi:hypothetical protein